SSSNITTAGAPGSTVEPCGPAGALKQATEAFVEAGARLAEALRQVKAGLFTSSEGAAIVVKAGSEISACGVGADGGPSPADAGELVETLEPTLEPTPTTLPILPPFPEVPSVPLFRSAAA